MPKTKFSTLKDFPITVVFDGLGFGFSVSRWYCLHAVFYGQNGPSIMEFVKVSGLLRSWALLHRESCKGFCMSD